MEQQFFNNMSEKVVDDLRKTVVAGSRLSIAAASFKSEKDLLEVVLENRLDCIANFIRGKVIAKGDEENMPVVARFDKIGKCQSVVEKSKEDRDRLLLQIMMGNISL